MPWAHAQVASGEPGIQDQQPGALLSLLQSCEPAGPPQRWGKEAPTRTSPPQVPLQGAWLCWWSPLSRPRGKEASSPQKQCLSPSRPTPASTPRAPLTDMLISGTEWAKAQRAETVSQREEAGAQREEEGVRGRRQEAGRGKQGEGKSVAFFFARRL